jgi:signal transduction histidine kinase
MTEEIFPGQSELARRMRALDWSQTPLGPVDTWPQSLRTSVSTCLDCAFPIVLWWGPELAILYNDEYQQLMGPAKASWALGQPGREVWKEIWDVIDPMLARVVRDGEPTRSRDLLLHVDRGYLEEAYFSFSYSPIRAEGGKVGGVFCPVIETTDKVIGERRLRTLRDLANRCKGAGSEEAVCAAAAEVLASNPYDVPFAMIYRIDEDAGGACLAAAAGIAAGTAASPRHVALYPTEAGPWSLGDVARTGEGATVCDLRDTFAMLPTGAWTSPPHTATILPVLLPGHERPRAILVAAVSPMRALDDDYRTFFGLVATQIASGLADADALEQERRRAKALAELDRAKTVFFSNVSHEFRTPLTLMIGPLEDLRTAGSLPEDAAASLDVAHRNSLRLLKLVNTLLDFSRIEAGRIDASYEPIDLAAATADLASVFRSAVEKAGLRLVVDCPPLPGPVYVDRDMWEKIVLNLLSNAFKFTLEGEIAVALRCLEDRVELTVRDTGTGICEAELPRVFERFHRVKNARARTHEGTGIGLSLVQELARLHGGSVTAASREGSGSTFTVSVRTGSSHLPPDRIASARLLTPTSVGARPYVEEALRWLPNGDQPAPREASVTEIPSETAARSPATPARVLVVDDNADMREYVTRLLSSARYQVEAFADGQAALARIVVDPPDLVLTDVMMPQVDGFTLLAAVRRDERTRSLPVILLSARAGEEARLEGLRAGADEYIVKPFSARELLARVGSQIELARLRNETSLALAESERRLREADRRKDEFLALLAHELRNPLAPIRTGLELIRLSGDRPATVRRMRAMMERQLGHMVRLIDDLLDVSRITSGKIVLQRVPTPIDELVQGAMDAQQAAIEAAGITLSVRLPDRPCIVDVDPTRFVQVLSNVLHNAVKFTPARGTIQVVAQAPPEHSIRGDVTIAVSDTGIGISAQMLPRVFDLFVQGDHSAGSQHGLGIGLALARRLMEMHDGRIDARSDGAGLGSTFTIKVPLSQRPVERPATSGDARQLKSRVLIVDDNQDAANSMAMLVEALGGTARTAYDAMAGLDAVSEFRPDVVVLDIGLPGIDGYELCQQIRLRPSDRHTVVIALTGWGHPQDKLRALDVGFDAHLTKPVDPAAFQELLTVSRTA